MGSESPLYVESATMCGADGSSFSGSDIGYQKNRRITRGTT